MQQANEAIEDLKQLTDLVGPNPRIIPDVYTNKPLPDKRRAGYTKSKGAGTSKKRRKMAKESRRRNSR